MEILNLKLKQQDLGATDEAKKVALEVLSRAKNRPNFGNAGEVENQLTLAKGRFQSRQSSSKAQDRSYDVIFNPEDFDADYRRGAKATTNLQNLFRGIIGCEEVIKKLENYQKLAQGLKARGLDPRETVPTNFLFKGPPGEFPIDPRCLGVGTYTDVGTGKTTTARKMGQVFYDMGFLSGTDVIDCSASDLIATHVGGTGPQTRAQLEKALGKVLFIDEAYRLAAGHFAREAMDELVDQLTKPQFKGKMIVILAGYDQDINGLIAGNPGLSSRFPEEIIFRNMGTEDCLKLLEQELRTKQIKAPLMKNQGSFQYEALVNILDQLASLPSWGNARDIQTMAKTLTNSVFASNPDPDAALEVSFEDILACSQTMLTARQDRHQNQPMSTVPDPSPAKFREVFPSKPTTTTATTTTAVAAVKADPPRPKDCCKVDQISESVAQPKAARDDGVSDAIWNQLQADKQAAEQDHKTRIAATANQQEVERVAKNQERLALARLQRLEKSQAKENSERDELKRKQEEARLEQENARIARLKAEAELKRMRAVEDHRRKEEQRVQEKLRMIGRCVAGYAWIKQADGYRCSAGGHFVGNDALGL